MNYSFFHFQAKHQKSKSTMYLNEDHLRPTSNPHQGNIVRFLRSLVVSKSSGKNQKSRVFGKDLKQHLTEIKQESKLVIYLLFRKKGLCLIKHIPVKCFKDLPYFWNMKTYQYVVFVSFHHTQYFFFFLMKCPSPSNIRKVSRGKTKVGITK